MRFKKWKMRVLYNETHLGLPQTICNTNIHECENCGLIQTKYVLGKAVWEGLIVESHAPS